MVWVLYLETIFFVSSLFKKIATREFRLMVQNRTDLLALARGLVEEFDFSLQVRLLAVIASISLEKSDIEVFKKTAHLHSRKKCSAKAFALVVWAVAKSMDFKGARSLAGEMVGMNTFWHAQALIGILRSTGNPQDGAQARSVMRNLEGFEAKCAKKDLLIALRNGNSAPPSLVEELKMLVQILVRFRKCIDDPNEKESARTIHILVENALGSIFDKIMR